MASFQDELKALFGDDDLAEQYAGRVAGVNREIEDANLIRRAADEEGAASDSAPENGDTPAVQPVSPTTPPEEGDAPEEGEDTEDPDANGDEGRAVRVSLNESAMRAISALVLDDLRGLITEQVAGFREEVATLRTQMEARDTELATVREELRQVREADTRADQPMAWLTSVREQVRPSEKREDVPEEVQTAVTKSQRSSGVGFGAQAATADSSQGGEK